MKIYLILLVAFCFNRINGDFTGCPMDGCESSLSHFVDLSIEQFDREIQWKRTDLLKKSTRGCVSNDQSTIICAVDQQYVSINVTNGQILWSIDLDHDDMGNTTSLPIVNYAGFVITANSSRCTLIDPVGDLAGTFDFIPKLMPPLAGPLITQDGQILVADAKSFVGIEDSGVPLGVQSFPPGFIRQSRSMSLLRSAARWYLVAEQNVSLTRSIIAAETSGSIVSRIHLAWTFEFGFESNRCGQSEGPILSVDRSWLFLANQTGILIVADQGDSAQLKDFISYPNLCNNNMAFSESDSILLFIDQTIENLLVLNITNRNLSSISLKNVYSEQIVAQLSRITILNDHQLIVLFVTASRRAILVLIDYFHQKLIDSIDLGSIEEIPVDQMFTQMTFTQNDDSNETFLIVAHRSIGLISLRLILNEKDKKFVFY